MMRFLKTKRGSFLNVDHIRSIYAHEIPSYTANGSEIYNVKAFMIGIEDGFDLVALDSYEKAKKMASYIIENLVQGGTPIVNPEQILADYPSLQKQDKRSNTEAA
jgi:hypothetical protein